LGKAPSQIVMGEVVRKMEPDFAVVECENPDGYCRIAPCCTLRSAMAKAVQAFLEKLDQYTLEDLLRPKLKLRRLLGVDQKMASAHGSNSFAKRARADKSRIAGSNNEGSAGFIKELVMIGKDGKSRQP
jgi:hypothetical protein